MFRRGVGLRVARLGERWREGVGRRWFAADGATSEASNPLQWYLSMLERHPIATKVVTSGVIGGLGDLACQTVIESKSFGGGENAGQGKVDGGGSGDGEGDGGGGGEGAESGGGGSGGKVDLARFGRFTFLNAALLAPVLHVVYGLLENRIRVPGWRGVLLRVAGDQLVFAPVIIGAMIASLKLLETGDISFTINSTAERLPSSLLANYSLWPAAQLISFTFIPLRFRVLWANIVGVFWSAYLSWSATTETKAKKKAQ